MNRVCRVSLLVTLMELLAVRGNAQPVVPGGSGIPAETACASLALVRLPELAALESSWIPATPASANAALPAHCRVRGRIEPAINFELWLPAGDAWNGRFLGLSEDRARAEIAVSGLPAAVLAGYAAASTDAGYSDVRFDWLSSDARLRDFAYRAVYEMSVKAQAIVAAFYQRPADYRYFNGCSLSGRQALMQAQHFPENYDGIIAGAPLNAFVDAQTATLWAMREAQPVPGQRLLGPRQLELLTAAATAQCDTLDGVTDGVMEDPRRCAFDPRRLQCNTGSAGQCLTPAQVAAAQSIYSGPSTRLQPSAGAREENRGSFPLFRTPATNSAAATIVLQTIEIPGFAIGSESNWSFANASGVPPLALEFFRRAVFGDLNWNWRNFDLGRDHAFASEEKGWIVDATSGDLSRFRDQGGKLIVYQGWNDTISPPEAAIAYLEDVESALLRAANPLGIATRDFARLFMVPGMAHCEGGIGTDRFDALRALEDWVERGIAPDRIEASRFEEEELVRTRPLCPYPQTARYRGSGDSELSGNFICTN